MAIRIYNTLTKTKDEFVPKTAGQVGIYLCGPTVYKEAHIGHMVGPVIFDTVKRYLTYCGYKVTWVVNITDVDDKLIAQATERAIPMAEVAREMTVDYLNNLRALGVDQIDHMPKATEHIEHILACIDGLIQKGHAYTSEGDVLFDVSRDPTYGKLSRRSAADQLGDGGGAACKKRNPGDFALWKAAKPGEPSWESPYGPGRPGWHIECSAMSKALLGTTFDIHGGGLDLVFPHHENEVAQSECLHDQPMARWWMHNGLLVAASSASKLGGKMSRSQGAGGLADMIAAQGGERLRFFLLRSHYRSTAVYGEEALTEAATSLETFYRYFERFFRLTRQRFYNLPVRASRTAGDTETTEGPLLAAVLALRTEFLQQMDDDFNTGGAVANLFEMVRELNRYIDTTKLEEEVRTLEAAQCGSSVRDPRVQLLVKATSVLRELSAILGLFRNAPTQRGGGDGMVPKLMQLFIDLRQEARGRKDFAVADRIRKGLTEIGISLEDRKDGTSYRIEKPET